MAAEAAADRPGGAVPAGDDQVVPALDEPSELHVGREGDLDGERIGEGISEQVLDVDQVEAAALRSVVHGCTLSHFTRFVNIIHTVCGSLFDLLCRQ